MRFIGFIETVGGVVVSANAIVVRQMEHKKKRITLADVFLGNEHMREWWRAIPKKVWRMGRMIWVLPIGMQTMLPSIKFHQWIA